MMESLDIRRRELLIQGGAAVAAAGLTLLGPTIPASAFPSRPGEEVVPWADPPPPVAAPQVVPRQLDWERLDSWITPNDRFFVVAHYGIPEVDAASYRLAVSGLVERPLSLTLDAIRARARREVACTVECSGNHGTPWLTSAIGTARWTGTPLAPLLQEAGLRPGGTEVVFYGADSGEEQIRTIKVQAPFARSMSVADAMAPEVMLCWEMNGAPLPRENGFPLRLVVPGWYGVASVKWLKRIEVRDTRYSGRFMGRDYVTVREEDVGGRKLAIENSVGRALLKSAPAKVTRQGGRYRILGAAWGGQVARVEARIDHGPWLPATIDRAEEAEFAWKIWSVDWPNPSPGEHTVTSRAVDAMERIQPAPEDPLIANKRTYWESNGQVTRRIRLS
ncbi:sulfite oxidase [Paeniroseomonas aquatica]|uniref:Sulfite oxidase n=1 Tax=Paeniroseomonas aquatica TaxID=373043 RepID=A0ABT8A0B3_9PROT|nr:sulfite oxidase [Paeniroseomonas aquatica]MDN3562979.1 sulfite oxidase [Paeniroseomonas aquatica]